MVGISSERIISATETVRQAIQNFSYIMHSMSIAYRLKEGIKEQKIKCVFFPCLSHHFLVYDMTFQPFQLYLL